MPSRLNCGVAKAANTGMAGVPVATPLLALGHGDSQRHGHDARPGQQCEAGLRGAAGGHDVVNQQHPSPGQAFEQSRVQPHGSPRGRRRHGAGGHRQGFVVPELARGAGRDPIGVPKRSSHRCADDMPQCRQPDHQVRFHGCHVLRDPLCQSVHDGERGLVGNEPRVRLGAIVAQRQDNPAPVTQRRCVVVLPKGWLE